MTRTKKSSCRQDSTTHRYGTYWHVCMRIHQVPGYWYWYTGTNLPGSNPHPSYRLAFRWELWVSKYFLVSLSNVFYLGAIWGTLDFSAVNFRFEQQGPSSNVRSRIFMGKSLDKSKMHGPPNIPVPVYAWKIVTQEWLYQASKIRHDVVKQPKYETEIERKDVKMTSRE